MLDQNTCYSDGAVGVSIDYSRAHREIERHGLDTWDNLKDFNRECWAVYSEPASEDHPAMIPAMRVLEWLGY